MIIILKDTKLAILISVYILFSIACSNATETKRDVESPNIILILADDLGYGDVGCYNPESKIPTPNLDKLARDGMLFTDAHSPSTVCTPTRYSIMTGQMAFRRKKSRLWLRRINNKAS